MILYADGWSSGNPGLGGSRVTDNNKKLLVSTDFSTVKTNNYYELLALLDACEFIDENNLNDSTVYCDSHIALGWLTKDPTFWVRDRHEIMHMVHQVRHLKDAHNIQILFWDTKQLGSIPADPGRK